jgi:RNA polymerase sigma-70 factor (ECF subfamily)
VDHIASSNSTPVGLGAGPSRFTTTVWTEVVNAQGASAESRHFMGLLIERYWRPVYHYLRRAGRAHEDAADLAQGFFATFLERGAIDYADQSRGRFRNFILVSVKRFLAEKHRAAAVRPKEVQTPDYDTAMHEKCFQSMAGGDAEADFARDWLKCLIENCMTRLKAECESLGKGSQFDVFNRRFIRDDGLGQPSYLEIAQLVGTTQKDVENLLAAARRRFRRIFYEEIRNSVMSDAETEAEIRDLFDIASA